MDKKENVSQNPFLGLPYLEFKRKVKRELESRFDSPPTLEDLNNLVLKDKTISLLIDALPSLNYRIASEESGKPEEVKALDLLYRGRVLKNDHNPHRLYSNMGSKELLNYVASRYHGKMPNDILETNGTLAMILEKRKANGKSLMQILVDNGDLQKGSKSHPQAGKKVRRCWRDLNGGFRAPSGHYSSQDWLSHYKISSRF